MQRTKVRSVIARKRRYVLCGPKAARHLTRTGAAPALRYGAAVIGATDTVLSAARSFACAAGGELRGRCTFARLHLDRYDPGVALATDPVVEWARVIWDDSANREDMVGAWKAALPLVSNAARPSKQ